MEEQKKLHLTLEQTHMVQPARPTPVHHHLYLSGVDLLMTGSKPSRTILFYPTPIHDAEHAFTTLHRGLAETLVPYYPFAGRLAHDVDGRLVLHCNDAGVQLILARCDGVSFSDLAADSFVPRPSFQQLVPLHHLSRSDHVDTPVTAVQITGFQGGFTLGITNLHTVADGFSFWMFVKALSKACRGEPITELPLHYRTLLRTDTLLLNKFPPRCLKHDIFPSLDDSYFTPSSDSSQEQGQLAQVLVHFSKEMIETLKNACNSSTNSAVPLFSTYQAMSAYLWKRYVMARAFEAKAPVQFLHYLDIRHRIVPPLRSAYCGNAVAGFITTSKAEDMKDEGLGATAARVRQTIQEVDDYSIKEFIKFLENPDWSRIQVFNLFRIRNAIHFPVYEAGDFGWGEPAAVRPPISDVVGEFTWYPSKKQTGGVDVVFALQDTICSEFFSPGLYAHDPLDVSLLAPKIFCQY